MMMDFYILVILVRIHSDFKYTYKLFYMYTNAGSNRRPSAHKTDALTN